MQYYLVPSCFPLTPTQITLNDLEWPFYFLTVIILYILQTNNIVFYCVTCFAIIVLSS